MIGKISKEQKELAKKQVQKILDYKKTFGSETGKRVLHDLMESNYVLSPTWSSSATPQDLAYREGARAMVLKILTILEVDPKKLRELARGDDNGAEE